jgi:hypothetical protein
LFAATELERIGACAFDTACRGEVDSQPAVTIAMLDNVSRICRKLNMGLHSSRLTDEARSAPNYSAHGIDFALRCASSVFSAVRERSGDSVRFSPQRRLGLPRFTPDAKSAELKVNRRSHWRTSRQWHTTSCRIRRDR